MLVHPDFGASWPQWSGATMQRSNFAGVRTGTAACSCSKWFATQFLCIGLSVQDSFRNARSGHSDLISNRFCKLWDVSLL